MKIPFSIEQFWNVFTNYNMTVFPAQLIILALGFIAYVLFIKGNPKHEKMIGFILGALWVWIGAVYHISFFTEINKAAFVFGIMFIVEGILIFITAIRERLNFKHSLKGTFLFGHFFTLYGLMIYPIICFMLEGELKKMISLGLPCPSTIFTCGMLIFLDKKAPKYLLIIPVIWAVIGLSAAISLGIYQDFVIILAALAALVSRFIKHEY